MCKLIILVNKYISPDSDSDEITTSLCLDVIIIIYEYLHQRFTYNTKLNIFFALFNSSEIMRKNMMSERSDWLAEQISYLRIPHIIKYYSTQYDNVCMAAVKINPYLIKYVHNQTRDICEEVIHQKSDIFRYIRKQDLNLCYRAIVKDINMLEYVTNKNKTYKLCLFAMSKNWKALKYMDSNMKGYNRFVSIAVYKNGNALQYVNSDTENYETHVFNGISNNGESLQYIEEKYKTQDIYWRALKQ